MIWGKVKPFVDDAKLIHKTARWDFNIWLLGLTPSQCTGIELALLQNIAWRAHFLTTQLKVIIRDQQISQHKILRAPKTVTKLESLQHHRKGTQDTALFSSFKSLLFDGFHSGQRREWKREKKKKGVNSFSPLGPRTRRKCKLFVLQRAQNVRAREREEERERKPKFTDNSRRIDNSV